MHPDVIRAPLCVAIPLGVSRCRLTRRGVVLTRVAFTAVRAVRFPTYSLLRGVCLRVFASALRCACLFF